MAWKQRKAMLRPARWFVVAASSRHRAMNVLGQRSESVASMFHSAIRERSI